MTAKKKLAREIQQLLVNPMNGAIVALATDGSAWIHDGQLAAHKQPWKALPALPKPGKDKPEKDDEDERTTLV